MGTRPDVDTADSLMAEVRSCGINVDRSIAARIDAAIERTSDDDGLGTLHLARALVFQGQGDVSVSATAAEAAVSHLTAAGRTGSAAFAAAMAAVFLDQCGETDAALEHAVEALVMLGDADSPTDGAPEEITGIRAALALSGFFMRRSAFELSMHAGRRAFEGADVLDGGGVDGVAFSFGYVASEAAHVTSDPVKRERNLAHVESVIDRLHESGHDTPAHRVLVGALSGEIRHARGDDSADLRLGDDERFYPATTSDLVAWHRLVRGTSALIAGDAAEAVRQLDLALPGLEASADNHCVVRALRNRSQAHALLGDHRRAHRDALDLADRVRRWQIDQVGGLADQLARRADLERTTSELERTAARLSDDIDRDATTGVHSRRWLERHLDELGGSVSRGAILMCDVDRFKTVNDTHGHHVGDAVLREFATLLVDTTVDSGVVARFGGEEFVIVLDGSDLRTAIAVAERTRQAVLSHDWSEIAAELRLSMSCGVAGGHLSEVRHLLVDADQALLDAKRRGRNRVVSTFVSED